ncbi:MAG: glycosyltransferase family 2 protein [Mycobacteriales bacterium]
MTGHRAPTVSVVVPTVGRLELLDRCLSGLAGQRGAPPFEVLVAHPGIPEVDRLLAGWAARSASWLRLAGVSGPRGAHAGASAQRNRGAGEASGELLAFTDDDCEPAPGWLAAAAAAARGGAVLVAGPVQPNPADAAVPRGPFARTVEVAVDAGLYPGCNLLVPRSAFRAAGGFDEQLSGGEDTDFAWRVRATGPVAFAPGALVWHAVRPVTFAGHLASLPRWSGLPLVVRRHPALRAAVWHRVWWKRTHPPALLALAGLAGAAADRRCLVLCLPVVGSRVRENGVRAGLALAVADVAEAAVLLGGSVRHRSLLL